LGKLRPEEFPFPLHLAAVEERLAELCAQIAASPLGRQYTPRELAEGFITLANATMSRAIRKISVAKGYDPAEYVLVTFGGAGGQHACAIAESLGMRSILAHPLAGVLSALGIGLADVRRHAERPILRPYGPEAWPVIEAAFRELEETLRREVQAEGIPPPCIELPTRSLELRYRGVEGTLTIVAPEDGDFAAAYEAQHQQVYGYRHRGRELEVVTARVEVVGRTPEPADDMQPVVARRPDPSTTVEVWFQGAPLSTGLFRRRELHAGDELIGPALLCEPTSTLVIDPGWSGTVTARGEILLRRREHTAGASFRPPARAVVPLSHSRRAGWDAPDPVRLELFHQQFASIAEQMGVVLQRTAISTNVKERLDFSCAIFDPQGNLVVNAPHIPVHLGAMSETVRAVKRDHPDLRPGDVVVTNDPYRGGSHLPDVTVVTPVHEPATGRLLFWTASRAHHAEIGGIVPGSLPPFSRNLAEEGVLIRSFRLVEAGTSREDELRRLLLSAPYPTRRVDDNLADVAAQVAANQLGARLLQQLVQAVGPQATFASMRQIQNAAAAKMRRALGRLGDREAVFTDFLDDGSPITVRLSIRREQAVLDFTGTGPVLPSNLNANRAIVTAAVMYVFRCLIEEDIPLNAGVLEPLTIHLPECLLNPPAHDDPRLCPAIVGGNVETSQRVVDVLLGALGVAAASQGTMNNLTFGDATFGYYETICGGSGATPQADGADAVHTHMTNTRLTDVEILEHRYPVRVRMFAIRRGSGGRGRRRGGDGVIRSLEFLRPLQVSMLSQRRPPWAPFGLAGGGPGASGRNTLHRRGEDVPQDLGGCFQIAVAPGDLLTIETPGGGAYGSPVPGAAQ
jgi:5-oxoprolinase (ATP-hydrolysing)